MNVLKPDFVSNYYKTSTFSFLSTNKAKLQQKVAERARNNINPAANSRDDGDESMDSQRREGENEEEKGHMFHTVDTGPKVILHIDMDCFYASVTTRDKPHLWRVPVAVSPAGRQGGTSEIACCNYPARGMGIKSRMLVKDALLKCPELLILTCEFEKYQKVSEKLFDIFFGVTNKVQALSVDEALLDITNCGGDVEGIALQIRNQIFEKTGCTASAGIGPNIMVAKLATRKAKPNGQLYVPTEKVTSFLQDIGVNLLQGVGEAITEKLGILGVKTIGDLSQVPLGVLKENFGDKKGNTLHENSKGIDDTLLQTQHERKSIGTQISWGVRFADMDQATKFLRDVSVEVATRMKEVGGVAKRVTLRVKRHKEGMEEAEKFLNPGSVVTSSKSSALAIPTADHEVIIAATLSIFKKMTIPPNEVRGIGLSVDLASSEEIKKKGASQSLNMFFEKKNANPTITPTSTTNNFPTNNTDRNPNNTHNNSNNTTNFNHSNSNSNHPTNTASTITTTTTTTNNNANHNHPTRVNEKRKGHNHDDIVSPSKKLKAKQGDLLSFFNKAK